MHSVVPLLAWITCTGHALKAPRTGTKQSFSSQALRSLKHPQSSGNPLKALASTLLAFNNLDASSGSRAHRTSLPLSQRLHHISMSEDKSSPPAIPPEKLSNLLLQCSIQAQLYYCNEFKNEFKAHWIESFLDHNHLRVERAAGRGGASGGTPLYKGLNGLLCSWREYLAKLIREPAKEHTIEYEIGIGDQAGMPPSTGYGPQGMKASWVMAKASRAANPYKKKNFKVVKQYLEPEKMAVELMSLTEELALEFKADLKFFVAPQGDVLQELCSKNSEACDIELRKADLGNLTNARLDFRQELPGILFDGLNDYTAYWNFDDEPPSPFRLGNLDLLQRAVTREAAICVLKELEANEDNACYAASALWLRELLEVYDELWENPRKTALAGLFLLELLTSSPIPKELPTDDATQGRAAIGLTDPALVASKVLEQRKAIALEWAELIGQSTKQQLRDVRDEFFNEKLKNS